MDIAMRLAELPVRLLRLVRARNESGLATYLHGQPGRGRATDWQLAFHRDQERHRAIIKGNQVGGSRACAAEAWMMATATHPFRRVERHQGLAWITVANWGNGYKAVCKNMIETCPRELVDWERCAYVEDDQRWVNDQIILRDGFKMVFRPSSGSSLSTASATLDWLWIDEPPSRSQWGELQQRCRRWQSPIWLDCTPIDKSQDLTWLKEEIEGDPTRGILPRVKWSIHKIAFIAANVPWMTPKAVAEERAKVGLGEAGARNDGDWEGESVGRVFRSYTAPADQLPLTGDDDEGEPDYWHLGVGIDWGEGAGKTVAVLISWRVNRARLPEIRVLGEYVSKETSDVPKDAAGIVAMLASFKTSDNQELLRLSQVERWVGDTNTLGKASPGHSINSSLEAELQALHLAATGESLRVRVDNAIKTTGAPQTGAALLQQAMARGLLFVDGGGCPTLDRALRRWEGGDDEYKHAIDALRYICYPLLVRYLGSRGGGSSPPSRGA